MQILTDIGQFLTDIATVAAILGVIWAIVYIIFPNEKQKIKDFIKTIWKRIINFLTIKNLPIREIDNFNLKTKLKVRFAQKIKNGIAKVRELHSSSKKQDSEESIEADTVDNKLVLKYKHVVHIEDRWVSYAVKEMPNKLLVDYLERGYFIIFTAYSDDLRILTFEIRFPERKRYAFLTSKPTTFFCLLEDIVADIDKLEEVCFVIRAFSKNKLEGKVQIYDFFLAKEIKCPKCGKKYKDLSNILCRCESIKELTEGIERE